MITARASCPPAASAAVLWLSAALALGVHLAALFAWNYSSERTLVIEVEGDSVEVALVEAAPAPAAPEATPETPKPELPPTPEPVPPPPVPEPVPEPVPPPKPPEMILPEPPKPAPSPAPPKPAQRTEPRPAATAQRTTAPSSSRPGTSSATASGAGKIIGRPAYIIRPGAAYPAESRTAGEQGLVVLRIALDARGRPISVRVGQSSGYPRLDRAAVEGAWRCRVSNAFEGALIDAPVRFTLRD